MTYDKTVTEESINKIWNAWSRRVGGLLIPGHDLPMTLERDSIQYIGTHQASIKAWLDDQLNKTTIISLTPSH
jgi:N-acyl homoserine lactone hydrolase